MPNGDGEIWLSGQIANPAVAYDPNSPCAQTNTCFYPTTATLCEQTGFSGVCGSGFPGYLQETDFTFDLILDTTSFNYVAPILQNNVPFFDGNWVPGALPPPPTWMTYPLPLIHCEAVAFVRSLPASNPTALPPGTRLGRRVYPDSLRAPRPESAAHGIGPALRRCYMLPLRGIFGKAGDARRRRAHV